MPSDQSSILPAHSDCSSGDSPFELVLWIPLTDAFSTNSMFLLNEQKSREYYQNIIHSNPQHLDISPSEYLDIKYGQYILFSPTYIHGNTLNQTESTRVSLNVRIKSPFSPYLPNPVADRMYGSYFKEWSISSTYRWNVEVYNSFK